MLNRYQSDYPNQVHQLVVSVSRHISLTKTGRLHFQKKPMDVSLANVSRSSKEHVVHYMIRDHYSGVFYGEICPSSALMPLADFLLRAWSRKESYLFYGAPDYITIPKTVADAFPDIHDAMASCGIETVRVTSGFQGGVRDIRTWEDNLRQYSSIDDDRLGNIKAWTPTTSAKLSAYLNGEYSDPTSKIKKWHDNIKVIKVPA
jgi:hypothetical protein